MKQTMSEPTLKTKKQEKVIHGEERTVAQIVDMYRLGGYDLRLSLCLNYRDLRMEFSAIEKTEEELFRSHN